MLENRHATRRTVLRTTGAALATAGLTGVTAADHVDEYIVYAMPNTPVYGTCDGASPIGTVPDMSRGIVERQCTTPSGEDWFDVDWDVASPDGWVRQADLYPHL